jgi:hypothetical protein
MNLFEWPDDTHQRVVDLGAMAVQDFSNLLAMSNMQIENQLVTTNAAGVAQLWPMHEHNCVKVMILLYNDHSCTMGGN